MKQPREAVLDSALLAYTTKLVGEQVERMVSGFRSYDPATFVAAMKRYLQTSEGVAELSHRARSFSLVTDSMTCMLGPLDVEVKARKAREAKKKDTIQESERPDDYDELAEDNKNESTKRIEVLHGNLKEMNLWKFIYDGSEDKGFGRSVENLFYASFLVRDGHAGIEVRGDQPFIFPTDAPTVQDYVDRRVSKHQCVVQFDHRMWLNLRQRLGNSTYLPAPTAVARDPNRPTNQARAASESPKNANGKRSTPASTELVSPNSKKRGRASLESQSSQARPSAHSMDDYDDDAMVSQVEATPEEKMPRAKRAKVKAE